MKNFLDEIKFVTDSIETLNKSLRYPGFPFVDVLFDEETHETIIRIAVAGFSKDELKVETEKDKLIVTGKHKQQSFGTLTYREQNIKKSDFIREFSLKKGAYISKIKLENGILEIVLEYETPEEDKRSEYVIYEE